MPLFSALKPEFPPISMGPKDDKKDGVLNGLIRHLLTTVGGSLVAKGYIGESELELTAGAIATLIGVIWSAIAKRRKKK